MSYRMVCAAIGVALVACLVVGGTQEETCPHILEEDRQAGGTQEDERLLASKVPHNSKGSCITKTVSTPSTNVANFCH